MFQKGSQVLGIQYHETWRPRKFYCLMSREPEKADNVLLQIYGNLISRRPCSKFDK